MSGERYYFACCRGEQFWRKIRSFIIQWKIVKFRDNIDKYLEAAKRYADKLNGGVIDKELLQKVNTKNYEAIIYYEKEITEEDLLLKEKRIEELKASILKRENLLGNENFVSRAPQDLVNKEKIKLEEEKQELDKLSN